MRMFYALPVMFCLVVLASGLSAAARADEAPMTPEDFVSTAYSMNQGEINAAEMALKQADAAQEVKGLADQLYRDHQRLAEQLAEIAQMRSLSVTRIADAQRRADTTRLAVLSGGSFDEAFLRTQTAAQERFIRFMERAVQQLDDAALREFAHAQIPLLRARLAQAKKPVALRSE